MPKFDWVLRDEDGNILENASTEGLTPPDERNWALISKFGLVVKGGASPSRAS